MKRLGATLLTVLLGVFQVFLFKPSAFAENLYTSALFSPATEYSIYYNRHSSEGSRTVFAGNTGTTQDEVFYYDGTSITQVTNFNSTDLRAEKVLISGDYIAWIEVKGSGDYMPPQVYMYSISSHQVTQITNDQLAKQEIDISGDLIIWNAVSQGSNFYDTAYMYRISTGQITQIVVDPSNGVSDAVVSGDIIYWCSNSGAFRKGINSNTVTQLSSGGCGNFDVSGAGIVWSELDSSAKSQIMWYDGQQVRQLTDDQSTNFGLPRVGNGVIVWISQANKAFLYDIHSQQTQIVDEHSHSINVRGDRLAWVVYTEQPSGQVVGSLFTKNLISGEVTQINTGNITLDFDPYIYVGDQYILWPGNDLVGHQSAYYSTKFGLPGTPTNLNANSPTNQKPALTWNTVADANSYKIYRGGSLIATSATANFTDFSLNVDGTYSYAVSAVNQNGQESPQSNPLTVVYDTAAPTVSNLTLNGGTLGAYFSTTVVTIRANANDGLSGVSGGEYYIDMDPGQGNGTPMTFASGQISKTTNFSGLTSGRHTLYVRSKDTAGNWSGVISTTFIFAF
jgi:hypothetical protein